MCKQHRSWLVVAVVTALVVFVGMRTLGTTAAQENRPRKTLIWTPLKGNVASSLRVSRAEVPGGWLVIVHELRERGNRNGSGYGFGIGIGSGVTFVPDPEHKWRTQ